MSNAKVQSSNEISNQHAKTSQKKISFDIKAFNIHLTFGFCHL
jgi:hypothetical protein